MANAADRVYAAIRARIENGAYPSGRRLKEEELAEELGVSRTPVREALRARQIIPRWARSAICLLLSPSSSP